MCEEKTYFSSQIDPFKQKKLHHKEEKMMKIKASIQIYILNLQMNIHK